MDVDDSEDESSREQSNALAAPSLLTNGSGGNATAPAPGDSVAVLLRSLRVERTSDGSVRFEAPPEAAGSLIALFEGMAKLLQQQSP